MYILHFGHIPCEFMNRFWHFSDKQFSSRYCQCLMWLDQTIWKFSWKRRRDCTWSYIEQGRGKHDIRCRRKPGASGGSVWTKVLRGLWAKRQRELAVLTGNTNLQEDCSSSWIQIRSEQGEATRHRYKLAVFLLGLTPMEDSSPLANLSAPANCLAFWAPFPISQEGTGIAWDEIGVTP